MLLAEPAGGRQGSHRRFETLNGCFHATCRGTRSLTVAVESGSQRVREIVNKKLATDEIVRCAQAAQVRCAALDAELWPCCGWSGIGEQHVPSLCFHSSSRSAALKPLWHAKAAPALPL